MKLMKKIVLLLLTGVLLIHTPKNNYTVTGTHTTTVNQISYDESNIEPYTYGDNGNVHTSY